MLGGDLVADLTSRMDTWPGAVTRFADTLAVARDPEVPISADVSEEQFVDPDAPVSLRFPMRLRRRRSHTGPIPDSNLTERSEERR